MVGLTEQDLEQIADFARTPSYERSPDLLTTDPEGHAENDREREE
jgi:hypothetical protein